MLQKVLETAIQLIFNPDTAWTRITERTSIYKEYLLPLWALITAASFLGNWAIATNGSFETGLKYAIMEFSILFISFQVASYFLNEYIKKTIPGAKSIKRAQIFVAYASALIYLLGLLIALINDFFFLWLFSIYTFYIVYIGAEIYYKITTDNKINFTVVTSLCIMGVPLIIRYLFSVIIPA